MNQDLIQDLIDAIEDAQTRWIECDWAHEHTVYSDGVERIEHCVGGNADLGCTTCEAGDEAAKAAIKEGDRAIRALRRGDIGSALEAVIAADKCEDEFGDSPVWGPVLDRVEHAFVCARAEYDV